MAVITSQLYIPTFYRLGVTSTYEVSTFPESAQFVSALINVVLYFSIWKDVLIVQSEYLEH